VLTNADFKIVYASGEDEPAEFFIDALLESKQFDLGLGYFSSSGIRALSFGFAFFISDGGKMRIIINDTLSLQDKEAFQKGIQSRPDELIEKAILEDVAKLAEMLSTQDKHFFNCLSWLIATRRLEFIAITPVHNSVGIAHHKFGIFKDNAGNKIAFSGSANFSSQALFHNLESISCYKSWTSEKSENERLEYFDRLFYKIWNGQSTVVRKIPIEQIKIAIRSQFPVNNIRELIEEEVAIAEELAKNRNLPPSLSHRFYLLSKKLHGNSDKPHFPQGQSPRDYQLQAYQNWVKSGNIGFFEMATGTGKTITSLNCALELYEQEGQIQVLILVPTIPLADQWKEEIESFGFDNVIVANSKNPNWTKEVIREINKALLSENTFYIVTTYASFNLPKFQAVINRLPESTLFIADEAHNFGTARTQENYPHKFKRRIGLSATPERHFDEQGTLSLLTLFNAVDKPTFKFDMREAIEKDFLCRYYYYPKLVKLTTVELEEYKNISKRLLKYFNSQGADFLENPIISALLLKRKRIIHKAQNKLDVFRGCLNEILTIKDKIKYTLVYVPEGKSSAFDEEDRKLINEYSTVLTNEFNVKQHQFIGTTENRSEILKRFADGGIEVLTAMKCLDEGVDVKRTELAVFCASTGNPRQFIQRRGRILRKHPEKSCAYIFDMIVIPDLDEKIFGESLQMERTILKNELKRVFEFASMSENKWQALKTLEDVASSYSIDIFSTEIS
jgi:superfamily II DNA or RNA helicase